MYFSNILLDDFNGLYILSIFRGLSIFFQGWTPANLVSQDDKEEEAVVPVGSRMQPEPGADSSD